MYLDVSPASLTMKPASQQGAKEIVLIGRGSAFDRLKAFTNSLKEGACASAD
jgi:hypothetical protein